MAHTAEEMKRHVRGYIVVFVALALLTIVTVAVSYIHFENHAYNVLLAMVIACIKGTLVAAFFMHLISEKQVIFWLLFLCAVFFVALMFLPLATESGIVRIGQ